MIADDTQVQRLAVEARSAGEAREQCGPLARTQESESYHMIHIFEYVTKFLMYFKMF